MKHTHETPHKISLVITTSLINCIFFLSYLVYFFKRNYLFSWFSIYSIIPTGSTHTKKINKKLFNSNTFHKNVGLSCRTHMRHTFIKENSSQNKNRATYKNCFYFGYTQTSYYIQLKSFRTFLRSFWIRKIHDYGIPKILFIYFKISRLGWISHYHLIHFKTMSIFGYLLMTKQNPIQLF